MVDSRRSSPLSGFPRAPRLAQGKGNEFRLVIDSTQEFLVQPVDASWLQCNIECQEACPVGTNCRGYLNLAAEGRFEEGYILSREPNPVAARFRYPLQLVPTGQASWHSMLHWSQDASTG